MKKRKPLTYLKSSVSILCSMVPLDTNLCVCTLDYFNNYIKNINFRFKNKFKK